MKNLKKILAAVLALATLTVSFAGCSPSGGDNSDASTESLSSSADNNSSKANVEKLDADVLLTINGKDISYDEYRYYFLNLKSMMDSGDSSYWEGTATESSVDSEGNSVAGKTAEEDAAAKLEYLKSSVLMYIQSYYATDILAEENSITVNDEIQQEIDDLYQEQIAQQGTEEEFKTYLEGMYCTPELVKVFVTSEVLGNKLVNKLYGEDFKANSLDNYVHAQHILLKTTDAEYDSQEIPEGATDEEIASINEANSAAGLEANTKLKTEQKALADEILIKAQNGDDFNELIKQYNQDPGEAANEDGTYDGYYFTTGEMVEEFESAAFALKDNAISDIIETSYGYHIIKRLPIDEKYIEDNLSTLIKNTDYYTEYTGLLEEAYNNMSTEFSDSYDLVTIDNIQ